MAKTYVRDTPNMLDDIRRRRNNFNELVDIVASMGKQANQRFYRLEKRGVAQSSYGYQRRQMETGKDKPRYTQSKNKLRQLDSGTLYEMALDLNAKLASKSTTITGLDYIEEKRLSSASASLANRYGIDLSPSDLKEFFKANGAEFLNSKYLDSTQILEDFVEFSKEGNLTVKQFLREFKRFNSIRSGSEATDAMRFDYTRLRKNLIAANDRAGKKRKK